MKAYKTYKRFANVFTKIFNILVILILLFSIVTAIQYKRNSLDSNVFGYKILFIGSGSMEPDIKENGLILAKKYEGQELHKGDIITFVAKLDDNTKVVVTHRIYNIKKDGIIITKGDNNRQADSIPITKEDIHFTYVKVFNQTAEIYDLWQTSSGKVTIICAILFIVFMIIAYNSFIKYLDEKYGAAVPVSFEDNDTNRFLIIKQGLTDSHYNYIYVDKITGVQYIFINSPTGSAFSPLLNEEGKPIIYDLDLLKVEEENSSKKNKAIP